MARRHAETFLELLKGEGFAKPNPRPMFPNPPGLLRVEPIPKGCATGSGGAPRPTRRPSGPRSWA